MNNKFIFLMLGILLISFTSAWTNSTFNNSLGTENLIFTGNENYTRWLSVPENTIVTNGFMNLSGNYANTIFQQTNSTSYVWNGVTGQRFNCTDNWLIGAIRIFTQSGNYIINLTKDDYTLIDNWTVDHGYWAEINLLSTQYQCSIGEILRVNIIYTGGGLDRIYTVYTSSEATPFFEDCVGGGGCVAGHNIKMSIHNINYTLNPSIFINNTRVWNQTGELNSTNSPQKTSNFATTINNYIKTATAVAGYYKIPFIFHSDTAGILQYSGLSFNNIGFIENSQTYNSSVLGGSLQNFYINISYDNNFYNSISVILNYNGTNYTTTKSGTTPNFIFNRQLAIPNFASESNVTFYFIVLLSNSSGINRFDSEINNQTISPFLVDDCSSYTKTLLNFTMFNEDNLNKINGTIETNVNIYSYGTTNLVQSYNKSFTYLTTTSSAVCLKNITQDYTMSYQIKYYGDATQFYTKYRNIQRMTINNNTLSQNISLYNLNKSKGYSFNVIVVGNLLSSSGSVGLLVDAQRQYLYLNEFKSIESSLTNAEGTAVSHLIQSSEIYNFIVSYNGEVLGTFNNYQVKCSNIYYEQCSITLNLAQSTGSSPDFVNYGNLTQLFLLDQTTHILYHTFSSTDGESKSVRSLVLKNDGYGNTTICNNSASGTSGTISCTIPSVYQNSTFFVQTFVNGEYVGSKLFSQGVDQDWYGADVIIILLMFSSMVLLFIAHPITIIIGGIMGLVLPLILISVAGASFATIMGALLFWVGGAVIAIIVISKKM